MASRAAGSAESPLAKLRGSLRSSSTFTANALRQTGGEIRRAPCLYCVGLTATLLTVLVAAVVQTLLARAPLIFLREAETAKGQLDVRITPLAGDNGFMNYSQFARSLRSAERAASFANHAPRLSVQIAELYSTQACTSPPDNGQRPPAAIAALNGWLASPLSTCASNAAGWGDYGLESDGSASGSAASWMYRLPKVPDASGNNSAPVTSAAVAAADGLGPLCGNGPCLGSWCTAKGPFGPGQMKQPLRGLNLLLVDTQREAESGIGRSWKQAALPAGGIAISSMLSKRLAVGVGDVVVAKLTNVAYLVRHALAPTIGGSSSGGPQALPPALDASGWGERSMLYGYDAAVPFIVSVVAPEPNYGGKIPADPTTTDATILGEFGPFLSHIAAHLHPAIACGGGPTNTTGTSNSSVGMVEASIAAADGGSTSQRLQLATVARAHSSGGDPYSYASEIVAGACVCFSSIGTPMNN